MADETNQDAGPLFTPAEREYFDSRGEKPIPAEPTPTTPPESTPQPSEASEPSEPSETAENEAPEQKQVPHGAFHEERARRKELEEKLRQAEQMQARMDERMRMWAQQMQPRPQPPKRPPTPDEDIFGHAQYLNQEVQRLRQTAQQYEQREQAKMMTERITNWTRQAEAEFRAQASDYDDALKFVQGQREAELQAMGMHPQAAQMQRLNEERQFMFDSARMNVNPAERLMRLAAARGYQRKAAASPDKQFDIIESGQQAAKSLGNVGGKAGGGNVIGINELSKMSDAEFASFKARNPAKYKRLLGG